MDMIDSNFNSVPNDDLDSPSCFGKIIKPMLGLVEVAQILGYTTKGLRKIVDRSRAKRQGVRTRGPTIKFFQTAKGAPIKFKRDWIEEFIAQHTVDPSASIDVAKPVKRCGRKPRASTPAPIASATTMFGLDESLMGSGT